MDTIVIIMFGSVLCSVTALSFYGAAPDPQEVGIK
jgi:hypothetical protein